MNNSVNITLEKYVKQIINMSTFNVGCSIEDISAGFISLLSANNRNKRKAIIYLIKNIKVIRLFILLYRMDLRLWLTLQDYDKIIRLSKTKLAFENFVVRFVKPSVDLTHWFYEIFH